jgi:hypothetical protein
MTPTRPSITLSGRANVMSLILKSMIEQHYETAPLPPRLSIGLDIDGQKLSVQSEGGAILIQPGTLAAAGAVFSGSLEHFLEALVRGTVVRSYLSGKLDFRGNPLEALKSYLWLRRVCASLKKTA